MRHYRIHSKNRTTSSPRLTQGQIQQQSRSKESSTTLPFPLSFPSPSDPTMQPVIPEVEDNTKLFSSTEVADAGDPSVDKDVLSWEDFILETLDA